jgi:hypothetical protein
MRFEPFNPQRPSIVVARFLAFGAAVVLVLVVFGVEGLVGSFRPSPACARSVPHDFAMKYARAQLQSRHYSSTFVNALQFDGYSDDDGEFFVQWSVPIDDRTTATFAAVGNGCKLDHFDGPGFITYTPLNQVTDPKVRR